MKNKRNNLAADISYIALLLLLFVCIVYIVGFAEHVTYSIVVLCMIFAVMIITHFTSLTLGLIFNITAIFGAATFIIYHIWSRGTAVSSEIYFWMIMSPVLTAVSYAIFYNMGELEAENERLNAYIKDFSIIDAGTGLKNLQAYEMEMPVYQRIAQRYGLELMLIVWEFWYEEDLKRMVGRDYMKQAVKKISAMMEGVVRKEDVIYLMSDQPYRWGTMMLTKRGSETVITQRLKGKFAALDLAEILGKNIPVVEMRIGTSYAEAGEEALSLYERTENELQYDV